MATRKGKIDGMAELERALRDLEKVPQTVVTQAARAGASIALKAARRNAPEDEGNLKKGIIMKRERRTQPAKAVFDVMMDPAMNDVFVKVSKDGERSYYPASQEYGFLTEDGGYVPGYRYMLRSITENETAIERATVDKAAKAVDKAMRGR